MANTTDNPPIPRAGVLLKHQTPDDASHFDWLLENPTQQPGSGPLVCFRVEIPLNEWPDNSPVDLVRIADHRRLYLDYEGPISGNRGSVTRVCRFTFTATQWSDTEAQLRITTLTQTLDAALQHVTNNRWQLKCLARPHPSPIME